MFRRRSPPACESAPCLSPRYWACSCTWPGGVYFAGGEMHRDAQAQSACGLDFLFAFSTRQRRCRGRSRADRNTAPRIAQRDEPIVRVLRPLLVQSLHARQIPELARRHASIRSVPISSRAGRTARADILLRVFVVRTLWQSSLTVVIPGRWPRPWPAGCRQSHVLRLHWPGVSRENIRLPPCRRPFAPVGHLMCQWVSTNPGMTIILRP